FFFSSRRRHTRSDRDWSSDVCSSDLQMKNAAAKMTMGQMSEALFILAIPFLFKRIGVKNMLLLGMAAWILRYICFAYGDTGSNRSEERRVGKECRSRCGLIH